MKQQHLLLVAPRSQSSEAIIAFARRLGLATLQTEEFASALPIMQQSLAPLILVRSQRPMEEISQFVRDCRAMHPLARVMIVSPGCSATELLELVEAGAADVLPGDDSTIDVCDSLATAFAQYQRWLHHGRRQLGAT